MLPIKAFASRSTRTCLQYHSRCFSLTAVQRQRPTASAATDLLRTLDDPATSTNASRESNSSRAISPSASGLVDILKRQTPAKPAQRADAAVAIQQHSDLEDIRPFANHRWRKGELYSPHDLSQEEQLKIADRKIRPPARIGKKKDLFDALRLDPLKEYKNFAMMSEYVSETGRIKSRLETGLRAKNQRRLAKAIRRAVGLGLMPGVSKHPELLARQERRRIQAFR